VRVLEPISRFGGNIKSVVHRREKKTKLGLVPVTVVLEIGERGRFRKMLSELRAKGVRITHVGEREELSKKVVLMAGRMGVEDLREITEKINRTGRARISDMRLSMGKEEMAVRLRLDGRDERTLEEAISLLEKISEKKGFLLMKAVEERA
jgi:ACT domain-containing protein